VAATYTVVTQYPTTEFLGGTQTRDVVAVGIQTIPHGIYTEVRIPQAAYDSHLVAAAALGAASIFEYLASIPNVVGVQWYQQPQPNGELADAVTITVASSSGDSTANLNVLVSALGPKEHEPQIEALSAQLDAAEGL
jgi:hypothetical protein